MAAIAEALRREGRRPYVIPIGASTPLGAMGFVQAIDELVTRGVIPDAIVHSTSSGAQAGLIAGCIKARIKTRVIGMSAELIVCRAGKARIRGILKGLAPLADLDAGGFEKARSTWTIDSLAAATVWNLTILEKRWAHRSHRSDLPRLHLHGQGDGGLDCAHAW